MVQPTFEQQRAVEAFGTGEHLVLQAGAGTGKTTTLNLLARARPRLRGRYIAFNRAIAQEAARKFPNTVACSTAHHLAMRAVGHRYTRRLDAPRIPSWKSGVALGLSLPATVGDKQMSQRALSYTMQRAVLRYCYSADDEIGTHHVPCPRGLSYELLPDLAELLVPFVRKAWADLQSPEKGVMRFTPDHYLKIWALTRPRIETEFLLLDEAQDTNPAVEEVFLGQGGHAQLVMVGDSAQSIYGWRGARDVMSEFHGRELALRQSFRFGPRLAIEANRWLTLLGSPLRLSGSAALNTEVGRAEHPDAILCRTNGGAMAAVLELLAAERRVALVGGGRPLADLANAAKELKAGRPAHHPELMLFKTWGELQDYAENDPDGSDLASLVAVIDDHGVDEVLDAVARLTDERWAEVTVSTAHKAKGREWNTVRLFDDFTPPPDDCDEFGDPVPGQVGDDEARLAYVAVTRARHRLDLGGLSWIETHPDGKAAGRAAAAHGGW